MTQLSIGAAADKLYKIRQSRYAAQHQVDRLAEEERRLKDYIISTLPKDTMGAQGKVARVSVITKEVPQIKDFEKFCRYVSDMGAWEMLQRRVSAKPVMERWENGVEVPGIEPFTVVDVSIQKV